MNAELEAQATKFYQGYYSQLEGATIEKFLGMNGADESLGIHRKFPQFQIRLKSGQTFYLEVSQDEEGNGGGFIFIGDTDPRDQE